MSVEVHKIRSPMSGIVIEVKSKAGEQVQLGDELVVLEAMKLETVIKAEVNGVIAHVFIREGQQSDAGQLLMTIAETTQAEMNIVSQNEQEQSLRSPGLEDLVQRKSFLYDDARPEATAKRKSKGKNSARENIALLTDPGSFVEYGGLTLAAQRSRKSEEELIQKTPADGIVTGIATIHEDIYGEASAQVMVLAYDYTVLAGTQGFMGHKKTDRMLQLASQRLLPIILFAEGGGGRPGDTDFQGVGGLDVKTFYLFARLSGLVPRIAIIGGYCFAGNASLAGCADIIIATRDSAIGMGGPAMIEGGGLGKYHPSEVGPSDVQSQNGVIDVLVENENDAIHLARQYLGYFQGRMEDWKCSNQEELRKMIPANRRRTYDVRKVIKSISDTDSFLELRKDFGRNMIVGMTRIEGRPLGLIANNPSQGGGAIDSDAADKASKLIQICEAFGMPLLSLCDTPGIMVGPEAEHAATVRHANRMFIIGSKATVPIFTIVTRRAYGLGSMAMAGGSFHVPHFTVSWPTGEFGGMGLEGAVKLGFRRELKAAENESERETLYEKLLAEAYAKGSAINTASYLEIDDVIDPADTRRWISMGLNSIDRKDHLKGNGNLIDAW